MDISTFLTIVFCIVDDFVKEQKLRQRGPEPKLSDSEVLTMEIVGEFLSIDQEEALFIYFRRHWADCFPTLKQVNRSTFVRQAANLWKVKEALWQEILTWIERDEQISIIDSFPVPVCRFARAKRCRLFETQAAFGYDELARQTYYGFRAHVRIEWPGVIVGLELTPANVHDLAAMDDMTADVQGYLLADRNYWSPAKRENLAQRALTLLAPYKSRKREQKRWPLWLIQMRRRIETVIGQLVGRFKAKSVWARDVWHLSSRFLRKILSHTLAFFLAQQLELDSPLQFDKLLID